MAVRSDLAALAARLLPSRWAWPRLVASPTSYLLALGLALTIAAKAAVLAALPDAATAWLPALVAADVALHLGLAALFAVGERRSPWILLASAPVALVVLLISALNAAYLGMTGEQLSWQGVAIGLDRLGEVSGIALESLGRVGAARWLAVVAVLVGAPAAAVVVLRRGTGGAHPTRSGGDRARAAGLVAAVALVVAIAAPTPASVPLRRLERSAALATYLGLLADDDAPADFAGSAPLALVEPEAVAALGRAARRPNVVVVVLESTRWDVTSLAGARGLARTPALAALAARGTEVAAARAVVPHTTKSLWTILCGRLPLMQLALYETSFTVSAQCLPHVVRAAGYRTAFFQSSLGAFEDRPRLVANLGFERFAAWEDIGGTPLGYLASDDGSLAGALAGFLDAGGPDAAGAPFFAVLLTSATHHPYRLPPAAAAAAAAADAPRATSFERYARLVEAEDALVAAVVADLERRGLLGSTIVVALGDHGEGFGDQGVKQHDTNFFEEGLRVPWVMAGPGVPVQRVGGAASLLDVAPTLLDALDVPLADGAAAALPGASVLGGAAPPGPRPFGCWFDGKCRGYVADDGGATTKVVLVPETDLAFAFDLARDPGERTARPLDRREREILRGVGERIDRHRTATWPFELGRLDVFPPWSCPAGRPCRHPRSPPGGLFPAAPE